MRDACGDGYGLHRLYLLLSIGAALIGNIALDDGADGSLQGPSQGGDRGWRWYPMISTETDNDMRLESGI